MKKHLNILLLSIGIFSITTSSVMAQGDKPAPSWHKETPSEKTKRLQWWTHDRFGLFIHWGIYALPARHEWVKLYERISNEDYQKYFDRFDPDLYDPQEWAKKAKQAGMKYVVLTAKHHDGFCLWDSKYTEFKASNTPHGKDLIKPFVEAFRAEGIKVGLYYSLIDWNHPQFPYDQLHPNRPKTRQAQDKANKGRDMNKYRQYMKNQITELLTNYGQIDLLFMDYSYPGENGKGHKEWDSESLLQLVRKLQPQIIVNDRLDLSDTTWGWDFITPEQFMPQSNPTVNGKKVPWETCQTFSGSWGYYRDQYTWKNTHQLIVMLVETVSKGGNLLLNVGPTARGVFEDRANERLNGLAKWMKFHSRSVYGCSEAPKEFAVPQNCFLTYNVEKKRLYIHVLEWPFKSLHLPNYKGKIKYAQLLNDASELKYYSNPRKESGDHMSEISGENDLILNLPVEKPNVDLPVIELFLE